MGNAYSCKIVPKASSLAQVKVGADDHACEAGAPGKNMPNTRFAGALDTES